MRLFLPLKQTIKDVGEKHKYKGLVMLQSTWQAIELSSLLDNAAQYTPREKPVLVGPPEACTSPELLGRVAAALLHHLVVCRGAWKKSALLLFSSSAYTMAFYERAW